MKPSAPALVLVLTLSVAARADPPLEPLDPVRDALMLEPPRRARYETLLRWQPRMSITGVELFVASWLAPALIGAINHDGWWAVPIAGPGLALAGGRNVTHCDPQGGDSPLPDGCHSFQLVADGFAIAASVVQAIGVGLAVANLFNFERLRVRVAIAPAGRSIALGVRF